MHEIVAQKYARDKNSYFAKTTTFKAMKNYRVKMINGGSFSNIDTALDFQSNEGNSIWSNSIIKIIQY